MPGSPNAMRVCSGCGTIAPLESATCKPCGRDLANAAFVEPRPDGVMFAVALESDFQCRGCGLRSSLDSLYLDAEIDCHRCGMTQTFDTSQWEEGLAHAHAVADLSGPPPAGQGSVRHGVPLQGSNPFASLGVGFTSAELTKTGMTISAAGVVQQSLRIKVATGHPVCAEGHGPVQVDVGPASSRVTCGTCNAPATYTLPPLATKLAGGCCGVIDDEHRDGRPLVRMQASANSGAVALTCPACSASLPATPDSSIVTCTFCKAVSYLPKRAFLRLNPTQPSRPFWILFRGPSTKRTGASGGAAAEMPPSTVPAPEPPPPPPPMALRPGLANPAARRPFPVLIMAIVGVLLLGAVAAGVLFAMRPAKRAPSGQHAGHHGHH